MGCTIFLTNQREEILIETTVIGCDVFLQQGMNVGYFYDQDLQIGSQDVRLVGVIRGPKLPESSDEYIFDCAEVCRVRTKMSVYGGIVKQYCFTIAGACRCPLPEAISECEEISRE